MSVLKRERVGQLRPSQIMFTYGVGATIDLPYLSVLVLGLDDWPMDPGLTREIGEDRLLRAVQAEPELESVRRLLAPPAAPDGAGFTSPFDELAKIGVPVATFPRWLYCPRCQRLAHVRSGQFDPKPNPYHPDQTRYVHANCSKAARPPVAVPARFLVACENGHMDDFPWLEFVHQGPTDCASVLRLIEYGPTGEASELEVVCDTCERRRRLVQAFGEAGTVSMPQCRGRRPHLRDFDPKPCGEQLRAALLGASNLWFPDVLSTLAIPTESARLDQLVRDHWPVLDKCTSAEFVAFARQVGSLGAFVGYGDAAVWEAIQRKRAQDAGEAEGTNATDLRSPEWEILTNPAAKAETEDFRLRPVAVPAGFDGVVEQVVLVERLREVRALIGFTRIDAPGELGVDGADADTKRMRLSRRDPLWVPANEVRGEGIFVELREDAIREWLARGEVKERDAQFSDSHQRWRKARGVEPAEAGFPGMRYVLLHTLAHALMRTLALECGYTSASVRERVYSRGPDDSDGLPGPMAGILLYTSAPDSEGTLGGLVHLGQPEELGRHLRTALRDARLCASDPICAEHPPSGEGVTLHGAACHACLFSPETSCERGNRYLDRSVLAPTVDERHSPLAFFPSE